MDIASLLLGAGLQSTVLPCGFHLVQDRMAPGSQPQIELLDQFVVVELVGGTPFERDLAVHATRIPRHEIAVLPSEENFRNGRGIRNSGNNVAELCLHTTGARARLLVLTNV
jgi:hypothetical protein